MSCSAGPGPGVVSLVLASLVSRVGRVLLLVSPHWPGPCNVVPGTMKVSPIRSYSLSVPGSFAAGPAHFSLFRTAPCPICPSPFLPLFNSRVVHSAQPVPPDPAFLPHRRSGPSRLALVPPFLYHPRAAGPAPLLSCAGGPHLVISPGR